MQEFTGVYYQQREALYELLKKELLTDIEIKPAFLVQMVSVIAHFMGVEVLEANFLPSAEKFRDSFFCLEEKKRNEFVALLEKDGANGVKFPAEIAKDIEQVASDIWRLILCLKAQEIAGFRDFKKYLEKIIKPNTKHNLLELHVLYHELSRSKYFKQLTINHELPLEQAQLSRYFSLMFLYAQHIISKKATDTPLNFQNTEDTWLNAFTSSIHELVDEFSGLTDATRNALFEQLIEDGDADCLAIINNEEYPEQQQDREIWSAIDYYWPELVLLINDPEAASYFKCIFLQGKDKLILSPKESLDLQSRVKLILMDKMKMDNDRAQEVERLGQENAAMRRQLAQLAQRKEQDAAEPPQKQAKVDDQAHLLLEQRDNFLAQFQQLTTERDQALARLTEVEPALSQAQEKIKSLEAQRDQALARLTEVEPALSQAQERIKSLEAEQEKRTLSLTRLTSKFGKRVTADEEGEFLKLKSFKGSAPSPESPQDVKKFKKEPTPPTPVVENRNQRFFIGAEAPVPDRNHIQPLSKEDAKRCAADLMKNFK